MCHRMSKVLHQLDGQSIVCSIIHHVFCEVFFSWRWWGCTCNHWCTLLKQHSCVGKMFIEKLHEHHYVILQRDWCISNFESGSDWKKRQPHFSLKSFPNGKETEFIWYFPQSIIALYNKKNPHPCSSLIVYIQHYLYLRGNLGLIIFPKEIQGTALELNHQPWGWLLNIYQQCVTMLYRSKTVLLTLRFQVNIRQRKSARNLFGITLPLQ